MSAWLGARLALEGLGRRSPWLIALVGLSAVFVLGWLERSQDPAYALDRTLVGAAFGWVAPLCSYFWFEAVHRRQRSSELFAPLARHGESRRSLALGVAAMLSAACAALGASIGGVAVVATLGADTSRLVPELVTCGWSGALVGLAYAGLFTLGSRFGRAGRLALLAADWVLGAGGGYFAFPFPRGHARSLLGGAPVLEAPQSTAILVLAGIALLCPLFSMAREPR